jgi:spore coat polysaccharide biosynthesis predicted glycosyltransferase SpsG
MRLVFHCDASASVGLGHAMRCVAIAEAAIALGHDPWFALPVDSVALPIVLGRRLAIEPPVASDGGHATSMDADVIVFDGYSFTNSDFSRARSAGSRVAAIVDDPVGRIDVDVVICPDGVDGASFELPNGCVLLAGVEFAPIRREFVTMRRVRDPGASTLLVTLGGADPRGALPFVLDALDRARPFDEVRVVIGPAAAPLDRERPWLVELRDVRDMATVMDGADAAISASGTTAWELATLGVPSAIFRVAENQRRLHAITVDAGAALDAGVFSGGFDDLESVVERLADPRVQHALGQRALELVDGRGGSRVASAITDLPLS